MIKIIHPIILLLISVTFSNAQIDALEVKKNTIDLNNINTKTGEEKLNQLDFDGVNDYVNLNSISSKMSALGNNFTMEFWTNYLQADNASDYGTIFSANANNGANRFLLRASGAGDNTFGIVVYINEGGTNRYIYGNTPTGDGRCHHVALTYDNGNCCIYIDGVLDVCDSYTINFMSNDLFSFGQEYDLGPVTSGFFEGTIDDFRVWEETRTVTQINDNMNLELTGSETNLSVYYNFNQGTASSNNTSITELNNQASSSDIGLLNGFALNGATSNFIIGNCKGNVSINDYSQEEDQPLSYFNDANLLSFSSKEEWDKMTTHIYDTTGKLCLKNEEDKTSSSQIDISQLQSGLYLVKVVRDNQAGSFKIFK